MKSGGKISVLVTAVGSELALCIIKAIKKSKLNIDLIGCDIYEDVVGKQWSNHFYQVPLAVKQDEYLAKIRSIIDKHHVQAIIPTSDGEFEILSYIKGELLNKYNCHVLVNDVSEYKRFDDKWEAHRWYISNNISAPDTRLVDGNLTDIADEIKFPIIIKPRKGGGSRHIYKAGSIEELQRYYPVVPEAIIQEFLDGEEYTAGTYRLKDKNEVWCIIMKRNLKFGMTNKAWVINNKDLEQFCKDIIFKTNLVGSNNIQFRMDKNQPKVLEINPRFSGTTGIRAYFGFNDVEMWIREVVLDDEIKAPQIREGYVLRYMDEQYYFKN